jgi:hypothetical protein
MYDCTSEDVRGEGIRRLGQSIYGGYPFTCIGGVVQGRGYMIQDMLGRSMHGEYPCTDIDAQG